MRRKTKKKPSRVIRRPALLKLDLGSGQHPAEGFKGVDIAPVTDFQFDLCSGETWPWSSDSVDELRASHFIEHIPASYVVLEGDPNDPESEYCGMCGHSDGCKDPAHAWRQDALFRFFDEAFRVAKNGATLHLIWPALQNIRAFMDPTHRRFIPQETMLYLNREWRKANALDHYNVNCHWVVTGGAPTIPNGPRFEGDQPITQRPDVVQRRMFSECWNVVQDFHVTLKAVKA